MLSIKMLKNGPLVVEGEVQILSPENEIIRKEKSVLYAVVEKAKKTFLRWSTSKLRKKKHCQTGLCFGIMFIRNTADHKYTGRGEDLWALTIRSR